MGSFGEVGTIVAAIAAVVAATIFAVSARRRFRTLTIENERWRVLARERADRVNMFSHEIRTPLALILGATEVISQGQLGELNPRQRSMIDTITINGHVMAALAEDLLASARIGTQMFTMRTISVDLRRLASGVIADLRKLYPNSLSLECRGCPPHVRGDPQLLRQVLINLVSNAARHGGDGPISIGIWPGEDSVLLRVTDFGSGMTPEQRRDLFSRTLRGKSETGHGLGMIITREIVNLHGGQLFIDSDEHHGTTITARIPT